MAYELSELRTETRGLGTYCSVFVALKAGMEPDRRLKLALTDTRAVIAEAFSGSVPTREFESIRRVLSAGQASTNWENPD